jgi:hypothetical protein
VAAHGDDQREAGWRRTNRALGGSGALMLVAGVALALSVDALAALIAGIALAGLGGIALVSLAFLLVGQGEERDRARRPRG